MNEIKNLQYQTSDGTWTDCETGDTHGHYGLIKNKNSWQDNTNEMLKIAHNFVDNHPNKNDLLDGYNTIEERLLAKKRVSIGSDWYDDIRIRPERKQQPKIEMKKCDCGHTIPKSSVMSASMGNSCPDCYDRMSA